MRVYCQICSSNKLHKIEAYPSLERVTSDSQPRKNGGEIAVCEACGCVQKYADERWRLEVDEIYDNYSLYHQSLGSEQAIFDSVTGSYRSRSEILLSKLNSALSFSEVENVLDVGCGSGATLNVYSNFHSSWVLSGFELDASKYREKLNRIAGFTEIYDHNNSPPEGEFSFISSIHSLEHIVNPLNFLINLKRCFSDGAHLFIQVPDYDTNPFDLLIVDHCTHYTGPVLARLIEMAGYRVQLASAGWIKKELSLIAEINSSDEMTRGKKNISEELFLSIVKKVENDVNWLKRLYSLALSKSKSYGIAIFGTSIAGTWLAGALQDRVKYFVDEDPTRVGTEYRGLPVYHPTMLPDTTAVFIPLIPEIAHNIINRYRCHNINFCQVDGEYEKL